MLLSPLSTPRHKHDVARLGSRTMRRRKLAPDSEIGELAGHQAELTTAPRGTKSSGSTLPDRS